MITNETITELKKLISPISEMDEIELIYCNIEESEEPTFGLTIVYNGTNVLKLDYKKILFITGIIKKYINNLGIIFELSVISKKQMNEDFSSKETKETNLLENSEILYIKADECNIEKVKTR